MLRIISSKLSQRTPGDLSIPATNQQVLAPYQMVRKFIGTEMQKRKKQKDQAKWDRMRQRWEGLRDPANGTCRVCGQGMSVDPKGRPFCPDPECNLPKFSVPRPK